MSLSSRIDCRTTAARCQRAAVMPICRKFLVDAAGVSGVRPRLEAAYAPRSHAGPDLGKRSPVIRCPLVPEEPGAVRRLEGVVHLEPAPVRSVRVRPAAFVVVDAVPRVQLRGMVSDPRRGARAALPDAGEVLRGLGRRA